MAILAAQKLPNLETLSCLQVVATFGNIEICQNWQTQSFQEWKLLNKSKISKIGTSNLPELAKIGSFPSVETFDAPLLEALRYHKVSKSGVAEKDNAMFRQLIFCHIWILAVVKFGNKMILSESFIVLPARMLPNLEHPN